MRTIELTAYELNITLTDPKYQINVIENPKYRHFFLQELKQQFSELHPFVMSLVLSAENIAGFSEHAI